MNSLKLFLATFILNFFMAPLFAASPEFGKATYYNDKYHGKKTASGELYDKEKLTCAHKSLKFGTIVRITRLDDQRTVVARVNDRGPYSEGYVIDLSRAAAEQIGLIKSGNNVNVKVEVEEPEVPASPSTIKEVPVKESGSSKGGVAPVTSSTNSGVPMMPDLVKGKTPTATKTGATSDVFQKAETTAPKTLIEPALYQTSLVKVAEKGFGVQLQSLSAGDAALSEAAKLQATWPGQVLLKTEIGKGDVTSYKLIIGPFETKKEAEVQQKAATKKGHKKCFVVDLGQ